MQTLRVAKDEVEIHLSYDEALVLSDVLDRWYRDEVRQTFPAADPAEFRVLDDLRASFEPVIDEVFASDYTRVVEAARRRISP